MTTPPPPQPQPSVSVTGANAPAPIALFADAGLNPAVALNVPRCGYTSPTPVQRHALPILLAGRDLMACAQTGSGKTAAFCLPIISHIIDRASRGDGNGNAFRGGVMPVALVLAPTRELAQQIHEEALKFAYGTVVRPAVAYGGTPMFDQMRDLRRGADLLVATPGRLVDLVDRAKVSLNMVKFLVLDEADRMLDMGFERQIRKVIENSGMPPPGSRQTMLFSATLPQEIQDLASDFLSDYLFLTVGKVGSSTDLISQKVEYVTEMDKRGFLLNVLRSHTMTTVDGKKALVVVFVETKRSAYTLERWLLSKGFPTASIHGDKTQWEREAALKSFKSGQTPILVATDVAARGLDVPNIAHVINYDLPKDIENYVHRIGRTGRAGKSGVATAFFSECNQSLAKPLIGLMQEAKQEVPDWLQKFAGMSIGGGSNGGNNRRRVQGNGNGNAGGGKYLNAGARDYYRGGSSSSTYGGGYSAGYAAAASHPQFQAPVQGYYAYPAQTMPAATGWY